MASFKDINADFIYFLPQTWQKEATWVEFKELYHLCQWAHMGSLDQTTLAALRLRVESHLFIVFSMVLPSSLWAETWVFIIQEVSALTNCENKHFLVVL